MNRVRVKICGITSRRDALAAVNLGADAIGLCFYPKSKRYVEPQLAHEITAGLPPFVSVIGVVVNANLDELQTITERTRIDMWQCHGEESAEFCLQTLRPVIKAVRVDQQDTISQAIRRYQDVASAILLDSYSKSEYGGTGQTFPWQWIPTQTDVPLILAGGITPETIAEAIQTVSPYGIDVCSGVEKQPGVKDISALTSLMQTVRQLGV